MSKKQLCDDKERYVQKSNLLVMFHTLYLGQWNTDHKRTAAGNEVDHQKTCHTNRRWAHSQCSHFYYPISLVLWSYKTLAEKPVSIKFLGTLPVILPRLVSPQMSCITEVWSQDQQFSRLLSISVSSVVVMCQSISNRALLLLGREG